MLGAVVGSALMLLVTALIAIPIGVGAAVYLEEFSPRNRLTDLIEVNINNLAAVPSIVYGLLGVALFINWMHLPRSLAAGRGSGAGPDGPADHHHRDPVVAEGRAALDPRGRPGHGRLQDPDGVPARPAAGHAGRHDRHHHLHGPCPGRDGAAAADRHGQLRAGHPRRPSTEPTGALPSLVYIWENASERAFHERTAAAILVLLAFMIVMNAAAILLRRRFERRW